MSSESAFDKRLTNESTMDKVEGLLEHFNLPPKVIDFIRANQKVIRIIIAIIVIVVVAWSLYNSHNKRVREEAASALSLARQAEPSAQAEAFRQVYEEYGSTSSALWAKIELAHIAMKDAAYNDASKQYASILGEVKMTNPLYPLILFSLAQSLEGEKLYGQAASQYDLLKAVKGFEYLGYAG
ncbi:MAG: tetratricopeptide repeat protein, partial [Desulforhopalus sp.]